MAVSSGSSSGSAQSTAMSRLNTYKCRSMHGPTLLRKSYSHAATAELSSRHRGILMRVEIHEAEASILLLVRFIGRRVNDHIHHALCTDKNRSMGEIDAIRRHSPTTFTSSSRISSFDFVLGIFPMNKRIFATLPLALIIFPGRMANPFS